MTFNAIAPFRSTHPYTQDDESSLAWIEGWFTIDLGKDLVVMLRSKRLIPRKASLLTASTGYFPNTEI